ncbi:hypothetical protein [Methylobacterium pseudosasicola]|nr:hypothetical protein [Methylobacterium pseudosasicola]
MLSRLRIMLRGRAPEPQRLPSTEAQFGVPEPRDATRDLKDAALAGPDLLAATNRYPLR